VACKVVVSLDDARAKDRAGGFIGEVLKAARAAAETRR
jgi:hypothetical protein